jgi:hypothetical protein
VTLKLIYILISYERVHKRWFIKIEYHEPNKNCDQSLIISPNGINAYRHLVCLIETLTMFKVWLLFPEVSPHTLPHVYCLSSYSLYDLIWFIVFNATFSNNFCSVHEEIISIRLYTTYFFCYDVEKYINFFKIRQIIGNKFK